MKRLFDYIRSKNMWLLIALFLPITFLQIAAFLQQPHFIVDVNARIGLTRYTIERIIYLLPITWAAFSYGWKAGASTSLAALICMLPRALFSSPVREDALVETVAIFMVGNLISYSFESLRMERYRRTRLEAAREEQGRIQDNLHFLLRYTTNAQEIERKRIAQELHDDTINTLVVHCQRMYDLAYNEQGLPEHVFKRLEEMRYQVSNTIQELRRLCQDLRPSALDRFGLLSALNQMASDMEEKSGICTRINVVGEERRLPSDIELELFRIVQETLRNIWKHSQATLAVTTIEFTKLKTKVTVSDNGKGFETRQMSNSLRNGKLGLAGIHERIKLLNGSLIVKSEMNKGTTIIAELPH
jgi:two-component system sensor histidine kinase DegS